MENEVQGTTSLWYTPTQRQVRKCLCCGKEFFQESYIKQDFCNRCYPIVCKAVFDKENGSLTCGQLKEKIRKEIGK